VARLRTIWADKPNVEPSWQPTGIRRGAWTNAHRIHVEKANDAIEAVLTTEKDLVDPCEDPGHLLAPLPLYWLRIGVQIDREDEFLDAISRPLR